MLAVSQTEGSSITDNLIILNKLEKWEKCHVGYKYGEE